MVFVHIFGVNWLQILFYELFRHVMDEPYYRKGARSWTLVKIIINLLNLDADADGNVQSNYINLFSYFKKFQISIIIIGIDKPFNTI
jgi:hypothetical protein